MPGRKRLRQEVSSFHAGQIERQADLLTIRLRDAQIGLSQFCPHGEAIMKLHTDLRTAVNILNNLPADYPRPNCHMSLEQGAWHDEIEQVRRVVGPYRARNVLGQTRTADWPGWGRCDRHVTRSW